MSSTILVAIEQELEEALCINAKRIQEIGKMFAFKIQGPGTLIYHRTIDCKLSPPMLLYTAQPDPDVTVEIRLDDLKTLVASPHLGLQMYLQNKIRISGDACLLPRLQEILTDG